jgi:transposase
MVGARSGASWRMMPHDFPPWPAVYQREAALVASGLLRGHGARDLRVLPRERAGRKAQPSAMELDSGTPQDGASSFVILIKNHQIISFDLMQRHCHTRTALARNRSRFEGDSYVS